MEIQVLHSDVLINLIQDEIINEFSVDPSEARFIWRHVTPITVGKLLHVL